MKHSELESVVARLAAEVETSHESTSFREAARATGGLPVYCDMGGCLVLFPNGEIAHFDTETQAMNKHVETRWKHLALLGASRRYPELLPLAPLRPPDANDCSSCAGTGLLLGIDCATCSGLGWESTVG